MLEIIFEKFKYRVIVSNNFTLQDVLDSLKIKYTSNVSYCPTKKIHYQIHNQISNIDLEANDVVVVK